MNQIDNGTANQKEYEQYQKRANFCINVTVYIFKTRQQCAAYPNTYKLQTFFTKDDGDKPKSKTILRHYSTITKKTALPLCVCTGSRWSTTVHLLTHSQP